MKSYRLLGYENRALNHADFKDDKVIFEPYGSGGYGVALYEITLGEAGESELKYQKPELTDLDFLKKATKERSYREFAAENLDELEPMISAI